MVRLITRCVSGLAVLLIFATLASAQAVSTAQINGTVRDASGGALPGVTVTATQTATGLKRETTTDENGSYVLTNLPVGPYQIDASLQGFRTFRQTGLVLEVSANPTVNVTLELGQLEETVSVVGNASMVETRSPGIGQVITNQQVLELPLNGRQLTQLIFLAGLATGGPDANAAQGASALNSVRNYPTVTIYGGRRHGERHHLPAGRRHAQRSLQQPEPAAAVPRRAAGVQGRDERAARAVRPSLGGRRQRRDQVGDEPAPRQRLRVLPRQSR